MNRRFAGWLACVALLVPGWAGAADPRIAILPVLVHSGASNASYLSDGLADMLSARLEQLGGMKVLRADAAAKAPVRLSQAVEQGKALGADFVLFGSFTQFGDGASLDLQCASTTAVEPEKVRSLFVQSGAIGDIIPKLDDVADKIAYYVLGDAVAKQAVAARAGGATPIRDLVRRLDDLERAVYGKSAAPPPAPAAAPATGSGSDGSDGDGGAAKSEKPKVPASTGASGKVQGPELPPKQGPPPEN